MSGFQANNVEFIGEWVKFHDGMMYLWTEDFFQDCMSEFVRLGQKIEGMLKSHIVENDLPWPKLSEITVAFKGHDHIFIETGQYYDGIRLETNYTGRLQAELLVYPTGSNEHSGISYDQIAFWQEYGTTRIPPRPLWTPVFIEMQETEEYKRLVELDVISRKLIKGSRLKRS